MPCTKLATRFPTRPFQSRSHPPHWIFPHVTTYTHRHISLVLSSQARPGLRWSKALSDEDFSPLHGDVLNAIGAGGVHAVGLGLELLNPGLGHVDEEDGNALLNTVSVPAQSRGRREEEGRNGT